MGYVIERPDRNGQVRYTAVYRDIKGRLRSAGTHSTEKRAEKAWHEAELNLSAGRIGDPKRGRQTLRRYILDDWFPNHVIEATTRENYTYLLNRYILPELGPMRIAEILPGHVREWVVKLQNVHGARPPTIREAKVVLDAIFTTALNDQITFLHAGKGVKTPPVAKKPKRIISAEHFDRIYRALTDDTMRLLVETDIESGLRWGELTELRVKDLDFPTGILTISRVVVHLKAKTRPEGVDFLVKDYPKDKEWRHVKLAPLILDKLKAHILAQGLGPDDLLFSMPKATGPRRRSVPDTLLDPATLGLTEPNQHGRRYRHGTATAYGAGKCRCEHCRNVVAAYRASRRAHGKDQPRSRRTVNTDGHIGNGWFRTNVWNKTLAEASLGFHVTPHGLRHAHASWLLAGGADLQVVKERLGHGSISTTEKYLHTLPGAHDSALRALDAIRGPGVQSGASEQEVPEAESELAEMRAMMARFKQLYESMGNVE